MRRALFAVILLVTSMLLVGQETNVQTAKTAGTPKPSVNGSSHKTETHGTTEERAEPAGIGRRRGGWIRGAIENCGVYADRARVSDE